MKKILIAFTLIILSFIGGITVSAADGDTTASDNKTTTDGTTTDGNGKSTNNNATPGGPQINCFGLPGCPDTDITKPLEYTSANQKEGNFITGFLSKFVGTLIGYTTTIGVIALMIAGIMYMTSGGNEEKTEKARKWIIWILTGIIASLLAFTVINIIDNLSFEISNNPSTDNKAKETPEPTPSSTPSVTETKK